MNENTLIKDKPFDKNIKKPKASYQKKAPKKITEKYLYNSGLAYLQRFPSSIENFKRIMGRKINKSCACHKEQELDDCNKLLEQTIATFTRMGLLNDNAYLSGMITSYRRRGLSKQAILAKLQQKGLANNDVLEHLQKHDDQIEPSYDPDFIAAILLIRRKKLGSFRTKEVFDYNKELASLARAGFGFDIANKALKLDIDSAKNILSETII